jgi:hypothetical protein
MTHMQKIDSSAMMRELTDHETMQVSGGFGESYNLPLPDSSVPVGYTVDDISDVQFVLDSATNQLTTILSFTPAADPYGYQISGIPIDREGNGSSTTTRTTSTTTTSPSATINGSATFNITIFGRGINVTIGGTATTGSTTRTTTTTTGTTGRASGGSTGRGGCNDRRGGCVRPN